MFIIRGLQYILSTTVYYLIIVTDFFNSLITLNMIEDSNNLQSFFNILQDKNIIQRRNTFRLVDKSVH